MELTHRLIQQMSAHEEGVQNGLYHIIVSFEIGKTGQLRPYEGDKPASASYSSEPIQISKGETIRLKSNGNYVIGSGNGYDEWYMCNIIAISDNDGVYEYTAESDTWITIIANELSVFLGMKVDKRWHEYTQIDEPIGFDGLTTQLQRHDFHGIGAESSVDTLEFYGRAAWIIKDAFQTDIDTEIIYEVIAGEEEIFKGAVDLSTYKELQGDYQSVSCRVGEIGAKTTFNNRVETEIDLDDPKTVDGVEIEKAEWLNLHIPLKHLLYTNTSKQDKESTISTSGGYNPRPETGVYVGTKAPYIFLPIGEVTNNEFGKFGVVNPYSTDDLSNVDSQYMANEDHIDTYGPDTIAEIEIKLKATIERRDGGWASSANTNIRWHLEARDTEGHVAKGGEQSIPASNFNDEGATFDLSCELNAALMAGGGIQYYLVFDFDMPSGATSRYFWSHITIHKGSYVKMKMYDNIEEKEQVNADMLLVQDALSTVIKSISENELDLRSEWYANTLRPGGGALKALTNGYKIRGLFTDEDNKRNMPMSFKALIQSLDAIDCIGWGFSNEDGRTCVRVERWDWFYKDNIILELDNAAELNIEVDTNRITTELQIGYKKYATQDQYNSIDSPHGTRTFVNGIKAMSNSISKECEFVADNYAIEETRRAKTNVNETEETSYDESIFVFELQKDVVDETSESTYQIAHSATGATNAGRGEELINAKITPRHMAARWRESLFTANNSTPLRFTTGEINYRAEFGVVPEVDYDGRVWSYTLRTFATTDPQTENDDIQYTPAMLRAEKITFSYPLTIGQYKKIKANPYGIIRVNGIDGWIQDFKYSFAEGMAEFTLIAKR